MSRELPLGTYASFQGFVANTANSGQRARRLAPSADNTASAMSGAKSLFGSFRPVRPPQSVCTSIIAGDEQGIPDLLRKVSAKSVLGNHSYVPIDIKSGKGYESGSSTAVKKTYGVQLAYYARLLKAVQGLYPQQAVVINIDGEEISFDPGEFKNSLEEMLPRVQALVAGDEIDEPARIGECAVCSWHDLCLERLTASGDVTLVAGVGRSYKLALKQAGISRVEDVTTLDNKQEKIKGVGNKRATTWSRQARVYVSNTIEVLDRTPIPTPPMRIYFDFEDDPLQDLIYLYGFLTVTPGGGSKYSFIWCEDHDGEERAFQEFLDLCKSLTGHPGGAAGAPMERTGGRRAGGSRRRPTTARFRSGFIPTTRI